MTYKKDKTFITPSTIAGIYILFGILWIVTSDYLALLVAHGNSTIYDFIQTIKGWLFVILSGLLIFLMISRRIKAIKKASEDKDEAIKSLEESERKFRKVINTSLDGYCLVDFRGNFLEVNDSYCKMVDYSREELLEMNVADIDTEESLEDVFKNIEHIRNTANLRITKVNKRKNGTLVTVELSISYVDEETGCFGVFVRDITDELSALEQITASEKKYKDLFENMSSGFALHEIITDDAGKPVDYKYLEINEAFTKLTGLTENIIGKRVTEVIPGIEKEPAAWLERYGRVALDGTPCTFEEHSSKLGNWYSIIAYSPEQGKFAVIVENITERKKIEMELKQERNLIERIMATSPVAITLLNNDGQIVYANLQAEKIFALEKDEITDRTYKDSRWEITTLSGEPLSPEELPFEIVKKSGKSVYGYEHAITFDDGKRNLLSINASPIYDEEGNLNSVVATIEDITERKTAAEKIRTNELRLRKLLEYMPISISISDMNGNFKIVNRMCCELSLYSEEELLKMNILDIDTELAQKIDLTEFPESLEEGKLDILHSHLRRADGSRFPAEIGITKIEFDKEELILAIARDLSYSRQLEEERAKASRLESIGLLAGGIAHDFNNILTALLGNLSMIDMHLKDDEQDNVRELLLESEFAGKRAIDLTQQLLTFSKGGEPIKKTSDLKKIIYDSAVFTLRGSNVKAKFDIDADLLTSEVDPGQISQVIHNIVKNADQAMPTGGIVEIIARNVDKTDNLSHAMKEGKYLEITIKDNGSGISSEFLPKIFEPYFTTKQKGNGLGLATSYSIINRHGGDIFVESSLGKGSSFRIYLPSSSNQIEEAEEMIDEITIRSGRVLIMDDEKPILNVGAKMLKIFDQEVLVCTSGEEAIKIFKQELAGGRKIDIALLDMTIPGGMGGKEAAPKLKEIDPAVALVVCSGYSEDPVMANPVEFKFDDILKKPYTLENLKELLNRVYSYTEL